MKYLFLIPLLITASCMSTSSNADTKVSLFNFSDSTAADAWTVQDDTVMGGRSEGHFEINSDGNGRFYGEVSLENNGGFSSIIHTFEESIDLTGTSSFQLLVKGDGKDYTLRVKSDLAQEYYHQASFPTRQGKWETVSVDFDDMSAVHHGEPVDVPNYLGKPVREMQLLIGNNEAQDFEILLKRIEAR